MKILYVSWEAFQGLLGPTWHQNPSKMVPGGVRIFLPVFVLGGVLGGLGASLGPRADFNRFLIDFRWILVVFWRIFEWFFNDFWYLRLRQQPATALGHLQRDWFIYESKFYQKSLKNHPKIHQKSIKIHQKSTKNLLKSALGPQEAPRPSQDPSKPENREEWTPPRPPFGKLFRPCWLPRATKGALKKHTNFSLIWKSIFHRFSSILPGFWEDLGPKLASKIH